MQETHQRLRDIINGVYFTSKFHLLCLFAHLSNPIIVNQLSEPEPEYDLSEEGEENPLYKYMKIFTLAEYTERKDQVFQVEQHLLRIMKFDFSQIDSKKYLTVISVSLQSDFRKLMKEFLVHKEI